MSDFRNQMEKLFWQQMGIDNPDILSIEEKKAWKEEKMAFLKGVSVGIELTSELYQNDG